jgi:hypothetical protein
MLPISPTLPRSATSQIPNLFHETDLKIHKTVIESELLSKLGALITLASTICYFAISTQFAWGIGLGIVSIAVDKLLFAESSASPAAEKPKESERSYSGGGGSRLSPYVDGQPIGIRNSSMNCWAISLFQFFLNAPGLRHILERREELKFFREAFTNYELQQASKSRVSRINSQAIRQWFAGYDDGISEDRSVQQDAHEPLALLMQRFMPLINIYYQRPENAQSNALVPSNNIHTISLKGHRGLNFERLVAQNYMQGEDDAGYFIRLFQSPPPYLVFHLNRFGGAWQRGQKINDQIQMSTTFNFPGAWAQSGEDGTYTCTAFIEHTGRSSRSGHYIAYVLVDGQWWLCDDDSVTPVSTREAERKLGSCYIAYFHKTEE